jgi:hypothetical protein
MWSAESVGNFIQAVLQGSFILAKAKQGPEVVRENLEYLRRTLRVLFQPNSYSEPKKKERHPPAPHPKPVEAPEAEPEVEEEYDSQRSHFVD